MTSLFDLDANSSDSEEDADYVPEANVSDVSISGDDASNDEESPQKSKASRKSKKKLKLIVEDTVKKTEKNESLNVSKEKADDIWKSFLSEVEQTPVKKEKTFESSIVSEPCIEKCPADTNELIQTGNSYNNDCTEILEFAGETIAVSKDGSVVDVHSNKNESEEEKDKNISTAHADVGQSGKRKGLQSVLGTIMNKKQKINTLQKSLIDWKSYKKEEGIEEDLQTFNRGKGGYIERQRFLERSNIRSYELERDVRLSKVKK